eukprot:scaffold29063_cov400-Skeletonema_menzelii.AAC.2
MAEARNDDEVFVYTGRDQEVPHGVRRVRIHKSVKIVPRRAFYNRRQLIYVEFHDEIEVIEEHAFDGCSSLSGCINLLGVKIIKTKAFYDCRALTGVKFGDVLETIQFSAFRGCKSFTSIKMLSVSTIGTHVFANCDELFDVEFGEPLRTLDRFAFLLCSKLNRVTLPLSRTVRFRAFYECPNLQIVDFVGDVQNTVASLHMESWRNELNNKINRINQILRVVGKEGKTEAIQQWMDTVIHKLNNYKAKHKALLKEATTLLELALWKAKLDDNGGGKLASEGVRTQGRGRKRARTESHVTSGAAVVIKNVLPFLELRDQR